MNPVEVLNKEHEAIEVELDELDFIMGDSGCPTSDSDEVNSGEVNYPNLVHTFWKLCKLWENHEEMEEELFKVMDKEGFNIPVKSIFLEHKSLKKQVKNIGDAINSGSDFKVRKILCKDVREFVDVLRKHAGDEEDVLSGVIVSEFSDEGMREIRRIVGKYRE
jgi:hemerythrin-like domain-containing protein